MGATGGAARLRGRGVEVTTLIATLDRTTSDRLSIALVEGVPGIGKSRVLAEVLDVARAREMQVYTGRAEELERTRPFGLLARTLQCSQSSADPQRRAVADLLATRVGDDGPITVSSDPGLRFQAVDALVDLIEALALRSPVVIGLDDLQWADPPSLLTLSALARRAGDVPVALIGCLRPAPRSEGLKLVLGDLDAAGAVRLALDELDEGAVTELIGDIVGSHPAVHLIGELRAAGGNPLFVTELLAAINEEGTIGTANGRTDAPRSSLPPTLRLTILRRLGFLADDTLSVLRVASILGTSFSVEDLATTTTRSVLDLSASLRDAIDAQVLEDDGDRVQFRHDLIRDAVYEDVPESVRLALHHEAGQRLAAAGAPALQVAGHLARAAAPGDAEAIDWLTRAAREVAPTSPSVAAELLQHAIELTAPLEPTRDALMTERAISLMWAGHLREAETACRAVIADGYTRELHAQVPARTCLAQMLVAQGRATDALAELDDVLHAEALPDHLTARGWGWAGLAHLSLADLDQCAIAATRALDTAVRTEDHVTASLGSCCLAAVEAQRARLDRSLHIMDEAVHRADASPNRDGHRYPVHLFRASTLRELDRYAESRSDLETGRRICEQLGVRWILPTFQMHLAVERFLVGEWDDARAELETGLELVGQTGQRYSVIHGFSILACIALHRGDLPSARSAVEQAGRELVEGGPRHRQHWLTRSRALLLEAEGDDARALETLRVGWDECVAAGLTLEHGVLGPDLVRLAVSTGEREPAEQVTAAVTELSQRADTPSHAGAALRCRGLIAGDAQLLGSAADAYTRAARPLEAALARAEAGSALADVGERAAATSLLRRSLRTFERLDATRDVARVDAQLRSLGVRRGRRGARRRPTVGWESLTPTERAVVDLVAEGLSNPQVGERLFISRRTVQTHLSHIFTKLDVSSRSQLAAVVGRRSGGPE